MEKHSSPSEGTDNMPSADELRFPAHTVGLWAWLPDPIGSGEFLWALVNAGTYPGGQILSSAYGGTSRTTLLAVARSAGLLTTAGHLFEMYSDVQPHGVTNWVRCPVLAVVDLPSPPAPGLPYPVPVQRAESARRLMTVEPAPASKRRSRLSLVPRSRDTHTATYKGNFRWIQRSAET